MSPSVLYLGGKRLFDLLAASCLLVIAFPVCVVVATLIKLDSRGPMLFKQDRVGRDRCPFGLMKFRTMREPTSEQVRHMTDTGRLTNLGRILRRTSLDELPQLVNVLKGELSLVGPRPMPLRYLPYFTATEDLRHTIPPGITGWAQVHGRNHASWSVRFANDVWYLEHRSFRLDMKILLMTATRVLRAVGVVDDPHSEMADFDEERRNRSTDRTAAGIIAPPW
jgi:lipopolysaccharide/colanic/teichoic acid biosynthesis glycosyltransferase